MPNLIKAAILGPDFFHRMPIGVGVCPSAAGQAQAVATVGTVEGICFFNTAAHRDVIQASCYPMASKTNCTTIVFKKFCITTRTRQRRSKPFLEREGFGFFVFGGVPTAQQKHPQRMTGLLQLRRSTLRMLIFLPCPLSGWESQGIGCVLMSFFGTRLRSRLPFVEQLSSKARLRGFIPPAADRH